MTKSQLEKKYDVQIDDDCTAWKSKKVGVTAYKKTDSIFDVQEVCRAKSLAELAIKLQEVETSCQTA